MSWTSGFGASSSSAQPSTTTTNGYPSKGDLDRNFQNGFPDDEEDYEMVDEMDDDDFDDEVMEEEG